MRNTQTRLHRAWCLARPVVGWGLIVLGLLGLVLPVLQGVLFLALGISLVGQRSYPIRLVRVQTRLLLKRWEALPVPLLRAPGRWLRRQQQELSRRQRRLRCSRQRHPCQHKQSGQESHARTPRS